MNRNKFIPYSKQYIDEADIKEVIKVLKSDFITQGPKIPEFENKLSEYCGCKYAVVFNSGTSALHSAYFVLGLKKNDEFITSPITFVATANAGLYLGAKSVFVDVEANTGNINASKIEKKITKKTKLLVPVHYTGHPVDLEKIHEIAKKNNLYVIEDACHALGSRYRGKGQGAKGEDKEWTKIGSCKYSDMTILSFHPVKHITTGEGGAVVTNNKEFYKKLLMFRTHGITKDKTQFKNYNNLHNYSICNNLISHVADWYYEMQFLGYNYRLTDIQAALGISQLKKLDGFVERRREIVDGYNKAFKNNPYFDIPVEKDYAFSSYHLYAVKLKNKFKYKKKEIFSGLIERGIGIQVHYMPVYLQPFYQALGYRQGLCPVAEDFYQKEISLPVYPSLAEEDVKYVVDNILESFNSKGTI